MSGDSWTIDAIYHALPHPELRQRFMREANFTPFADLPAVLTKWQRFTERIEAERPRIEALRDYHREHGQLPPEYETESPEGAALYQQWKTERHQGAA